MTRDEAKAALESANTALAVAAGIVRGERETIERLVGECRRLDGVGAPVDRSAWSGAERQAVGATFAPAYIAALAFERVYFERIEALSAAAASVGLALGTAVYDRDLPTAEDVRGILSPGGAA